MPNFTLRREGVKCASSGDFLSSMKKEPQANGVERPKKNLPPIFSCPRPSQPPSELPKSTPGHPVAALDAFFTASKVKLMTQVTKEEKRMDMAKFLIEARMGVWDV